MALARLAAEAGEELSTGSSLYFDCGDALTGSNTVWKNFEPSLEAMSALPCTAMAMGNREFNYQRRILDKRSSARSFPLLCSNLADLKLVPNAQAGEMAEACCNPWRIDLGSGPDSFRRALKDAASHRWLPSLLLTGGSLGSSRSLFVIGAVPVQYPHNCFWEKLFRFRFFQGADIIPAAASKMHVSESSATRLIVLSHLGFERDKELASQLPPGTWILGGHTHTLLAEPFCINGVFIAQTGAFAENLGILHYDIDNPVKSSYELIRI